jgi:hypothetical protein
LSGANAFDVRGYKDLEQSQKVVEQMSLEHLDDYVAGDNAVRVIDVFVDELDLASLGFEYPVELAA